GPAGAIVRAAQTGGCASMTSVQVLETTLRDGSYAINFSFTTADTAAIASGLEAGGFRWIEVGHGVGLGAGERGYGAAAASDEEYMQAASEALQRARRAIRCATPFPFGVHGHDNLGLAIANSLEMVRQGAGFVDTSLQGLGRSAGNAPTELMAAALARMGCETGIDFLGALRLGYKYVQPLMRARGRMPLDVVAGFAGFHSSFMPNVLKVASRRLVDAAQLIIAMCQLDQAHSDEAAL